MKKLSIYLLALVTLFFSACSESWLDSEPLTGLNGDTFYRSKKDAELAIVGCYDGIQSLYSTGIAFPILSEVASDNCFGGTGANDDYKYEIMDHFDLQISPAEVDMLNDNWKNYYKAIYRCNMLLLNIDKIDWEGDDAYKLSIESQAKFLRAYCYFDMVRLWERVPLLTVPSNENQPQAPADSTYTLIANDLLFAAENGAETVETGRVNKWAAKAMLARVYLFYTGYYGKAELAGISKAKVLEGLEDIIAGTGTNGYGLVDDYKNLWPAASSTPVPEDNSLTTTYAGKDNMETVFAIKYNITSNYNGDTDGNHWLVMLGLRTQSFSPYGRGWGACTVVPELYQAYEENDVRKEASIIAISQENLDFDNTDQRDYTGYTNKKYTPLSLPDGKDVAEANDAVNLMIGQYQDYVVIRYADVLLMAAELGSSNAQDYFDQVRTRAGFEDSKPVNQDNIMAERRLEFAFEGLRYWDLLRQGVNTAASTIAVSTTVQNAGLEEDKVIDSQKIIDTKGLFLIPQSQISLSSGLITQNDGWN